jgi:hypothetical protein
MTASKYFYIPRELRLRVDFGGKCMTVLFAQSPPRPEIRDQPVARYSFSGRKRNGFLRAFLNQATSSASSTRSSNSSYVLIGSITETGCPLRVTISGSVLPAFMTETVSASCFQVNFRTGFGEFLRLLFHSSLQSFGARKFLLCCKLSDVLSYLHRTKMRAAHGTEVRCFRSLRW